MQKIKIRKFKFWLELNEDKKDPNDKPSITLVAADEKGEEHAILEVDETMFFRYELEKEFGFNLDSNYKIKDIDLEPESDSKEGEIKKVKGRTQIIINCN